MQFSFPFVLSMNGLSKAAANSVGTVATGGSNVGKVLSAGDAPKRTILAPKGLPPATLGGKMPSAHRKVLEASWLEGQRVRAQRTESLRQDRIQKLQGSLAGKTPEEQELIRAQIKTLELALPADVPVEVPSMLRFAVLRVVVMGEGEVGSGVWVEKHRRDYDAQKLGVEVSLYPSGGGHLKLQRVRLKKEYPGMAIASHTYHGLDDAVVVELVKVSPGFHKEAEPAAAPSNSVGQTTSAAPSNNQLPDSMPGGTPAASSAATAAATVPSASAPASKRGMPKGTVNMVNHVIIHKRYWMSIDKAPYTLPRNVTVLVVLRQPAPAAPQLLGGPFDLYITVNNNSNKRATSSLVLRGAHIAKLKELLHERHWLGLDIRRGEAASDIPGALAAAAAAGKGLSDAGLQMPPFLTSSASAGVGAGGKAGAGPLPSVASAQGAYSEAIDLQGGDDEMLSSAAGDGNVDQDQKRQKQLQSLEAAVDAGWKQLSQLRQTWQLVLHAAPGGQAHPSGAPQIGPALAVAGMHAIRSAAEELRPVAKQLSLVLEDLLFTQQCSLDWRAGKLENARETLREKNRECLSLDEQLAAIYSKRTGVQNVLLAQSKHYSELAEVKHNESTVAKTVYDEEFASFKREQQCWQELFEKKNEQDKRKEELDRLLKAIAPPAIGADGQQGAGQDDAAAAGAGEQGPVVEPLLLVFVVSDEPAPLLPSPPPHPDNIALHHSDETPAYVFDREKAPEFRALSKQHAAAKDSAPPKSRTARRRAAAAAAAAVACGTALPHTAVSSDQAVLVSSNQQKRSLPSSSRSSRKRSVSAAAALAAEGLEPLPDIDSPPAKRQAAAAARARMREVEAALESSTDISQSADEETHSGMQDRGHADTDVDASADFEYAVQNDGVSEASSEPAGGRERPAGGTYSSHQGAAVEASISPARQPAQQPSTPKSARARSTSFDPFTGIDLTQGQRQQEDILMFQDIDVLKLQGSGLEAADTQAAETGAGAVAGASPMHPKATRQGAADAGGKQHADSYRLDALAQLAADMHHTSYPCTAAPAAATAAGPAGRGSEPHAGAGQGALGNAQAPAMQPGAVRPDTLGAGGPAAAQPFPAQQPLSAISPQLGAAGTSGSSAPAAAAAAPAVATTATAAAGPVAAVSAAAQVAGGAACVSGINASAVQRSAAAATVTVPAAIAAKPLKTAAASPVREPAMPAPPACAARAAAAAAISRAQLADADRVVVAKDATQQAVPVQRPQLMQPPMHQETSVSLSALTAGSPSATTAVSPSASSPQEQPARVDVEDISHQQQAMAEAWDATGAPTSALPLPQRFRLRMKAVKHNAAAGAAQSGAGAGAHAAGSGSGRSGSRAITPSPVAAEALRAASLASGPARVPPGAFSPGDTTGGKLVAEPRVVDLANAAGLDRQHGAPESAASQTHGSVQAASSTDAGLLLVWAPGAAQTEDDVLEGKLKDMLADRTPTLPFLPQPAAKRQRVHMPAASPVEHAVANVPQPAQLVPVRSVQAHSSLRFLSARQQQQQQVVEQQQQQQQEERAAALPRLTPRHSGGKAPETGDKVQHTEAQPATSHAALPQQAQSLQPRNLQAGAQPMPLHEVVPQLPLQQLQQQPLLPQLSPQALLQQAPQQLSLQHVSRQGLSPQQPVLQRASPQEQFSQQSLPQQASQLPVMTQHSAQQSLPLESVQLPTQQPAPPYQPPLELETHPSITHPTTSKPPNTHHAHTSASMLQASDVLSQPQGLPGQEQLSHASQGTATGHTAPTQAAGGHLVQSATTTEGAAFAAARQLGVSQADPPAVQQQQAHESLQAQELLEHQHQHYQQQLQQGDSLARSFLIEGPAAPAVGSGQVKAESQAPPPAAARATSAYRQQQSQLQPAGSGQLPQRMLLLQQQLQQMEEELRQQQQQQHVQAKQQPAISLADILSTTVSPVMQHSAVSHAAVPMPNLHVGQGLPPAGGSTGAMPVNSMPGHVSLSMSVDTAGLSAPQRAGHGVSQQGVAKLHELVSLPRLSPSDADLRDRLPAALTKLVRALRKVLVIGPDAVDELYDLLGDATGSIEDAGLAKWISHRYTLLRSMVADAEDAQDYEEILRFLKNALQALK